MEVPIKFVYDKRDQRCAALVGTAKRAMLILERMMSFQNLQQLQYRIEPYPGAEIICSKVFGARTVQINVAPVGGEKQVAIHKECLCLPHFTLGFIAVVHPAEPWTTEIMRAQRFRYDMVLCSKEKYIAAKDIWSSGWERYSPGQMVIVSIGAPIDIVEYPDFPEYDCDRFCLVKNPKFQELIVTPLIVPGEMKRWRRVQKSEFSKVW